MLQNKIEKLKLRDIIVAKKEVWENKQTNMIMPSQKIDMPNKNSSEIREQNWTTWNHVEVEEIKFSE